MNHSDNYFNKEETDSPRSLEGVQTCWHFDFSLAKPMQDFWPTEQEDNKFVFC